MDQLIKRVTAATGISEDQARSAVNTVRDFVKERLPESIGDEVDNAIDDAGGLADNVANDLGDMAARVGGAIFGKKAD
ncbi:MAG: hypothetical protein ABR501_12575 [Pyrinomonadaceae bacterium]